MKPCQKSVLRFAPGVIQTLSTNRKTRLRLVLQELAFVVVVFAASTLVMGLVWAVSWALMEVVR